MFVDAVSFRSKRRSNILHWHLNYYSLPIWPPAFRQNICCTSISVTKYEKAVFTNVSDIRFSVDDKRQLFSRKLARTTIIACLPSNNHAHARRTWSDEESCAPCGGSAPCRGRRWRFCDGDTAPLFRGRTLPESKARGGGRARPPICCLSCGRTKSHRP